MVVRGGNIQFAQKQVTLEDVGWPCVKKIRCTLVALLLVRCNPSDGGRTAKEYGLWSLPSKEYPNKSDGVTLKCTRKREATNHSSVEYVDNY